ncbi:glycosyltransferase family 2 protein [Bacillus amyloliquefaciens]
MIFTVAIPVYNDQNTIRDCLDSVVNQTVGEDKLEIICVNDGSTDKSGNILDEYMSKYKFIKVIHQQNSGAPGRPRNKAIEAATGDYIYFLDGDDYLGPEALEKMEEKIVQYQSDIIIGRYEGINRGVPVAVFKKNPDCFSFPGSNALFTMSAQKLFKRELLIKHNIRFPEHFSLGEDQPFMIQAYAYSNSIALVKDYPCYYLTNHQTIGRVQLTKKPLSGKSFMFRIEETLASIELLNLETDKKRLIFFHYWERIMEVELSALISKSFLIEDKIYIFNTLKKMLDKYQYLDYYQQFSSRHKLLLRLIERKDNWRI